MVVRFVALLAAAIALPAMPALGQEQDQLDPREIQAQKDCLTGKADAGVALLAELYAVTGNVNFVYNQARCFEQASRPGDAIDRFREYLRAAKDITAADKADVEKHIQECRALQAEQERDREKKAAAAAAAAPPPAPVAMAPVAPEPEAASPAAETTPGALDLTAQAAVEPTPIYRKWWFWTGIGAVVAAGAVTTVLLLTRSSGACDGASHTCLGVK